MKKGFTLIELIIVLAIIAVLVAILIAVLKPGIMFARLRDTQRISDLNTISKAIDIYISDFSSDPTKLILTNTTTVYTTGATPTTITPPLGGCKNTGTATIFYSAAGTASGVTLPTGFTLIGATSSRAVNGSGWVPIPFTQSSLINLSALPIDPRNSLTINANPSFYYTYACDGSNFTYELNAKLEILTDTAANDGGTAPTLYEVGPAKDLIPGATTTGYFPY